MAGLAGILESPTQGMGRKEAAAFLTRIGIPISSKTLTNMAANGNTGQSGGGPAFYKTSWKTVFYLESDLIAWASVRVRRVE